MRRSATRPRWFPRAALLVGGGLLAGGMTLPNLLSPAAAAPEPAATSVSAAPTPETPAALRDANPVAVAVSPDGRWALTATAGRDAVTLIDLGEKKVAAELPVGRQPTDLLWTSHDAAIVSLSEEDALAIVRVEDGALRATGRIVVGREPRGLAVMNATRLDPIGTVSVALAGEDAVAVVDLEAGRVTGRWACGGVPQGVEVSPDGKWLVATCSVPGEVWTWDRASGELQGRRKIFSSAFNLGLPAFSPESDSVVVPCAINRVFSVTPLNIERGWVIDNRIAKLPIPTGKPGDQDQMGLDVRQAAVGDAFAARLSPDHEYLAVSAGGTHEILVLRWKDLPWQPGDPGDFIRPELVNNKERFRRIPVGGRPLGITFLKSGELLVANALGNSLQCVDIRTGEVAWTVDLGGPAAPSLARRGEVVFYDAKRSLHDWFSCHTCHPNGHTAGQTFDTRNDRGYGTHKLIPSLRNVTHTEPWTWHGWQKSLGDAMQRSLNETMSSSHAVTPEDVTALLAYLETRNIPRHPVDEAARQDPAVFRGQAVFRGKGGCIHCHQGDYLTTNESFQVGLESPRDKYKEFNPPSLLGLKDRRRFLHDGRATTLEQVLTEHHRPEKVAGEAITADELADLVAYLKSL